MFSLLAVLLGVPLAVLLVVELEVLDVAWAWASIWFLLEIWLEGLLIQMD
ncbi:MAG: hypothetical protein NPIRA02_34990 [Nitrospirales bacterium]|nr:MAG: hypothetical protein NPIRA02_34990 [Nitrospirales bacterium]